MLAVMHDDATGEGRRSPLLLGLLLLGSGGCALVYQVTWLRELRLVFGASTAANAAVLAIFMGGLGLGGLLLGARADRHPRPLALYGRLELGVALAAALSPLLIDAARALYAWCGGTPVLGVAGGTLARLLLSVVVLGVPTFLMGGTLPAVVRAAARGGDPNRRWLGLLYALNTLGSVIGAMLATFVAIEALGIRASLWTAAAVNASVGAAALGLSGSFTATVGAAHVDAEGARAPAPLVLFAAGLTGFVFLLMELVWYRMLAPLLGGSSYSFGLILAVALLGIGLGGLGYGAWARRRSPSLLLFAGTAALEAILLAVPLAMGDGFALWAASLRPLGAESFGGLVGVWAVISAAAILPAAAVSGFQFPLLVGLLGRGADGVGRQVGQAYACNTLGAILGSLAGGFGLIPLLGAVGAWRLVAGLLLALGLAALLWASGDRTRRLGVALALAVGLAVASRPGPSAVWRHSPIGAGRFSLPTEPIAREDALRAVRRSIRWEVDGVESSIALQSTDGDAFVIHGKVDGHVFGDAPTNVWLGLLPALLHPDPEDALVIGLGTGQTAGWAAAGVSGTVDVIELEPAILAVARGCEGTNLGVMDNPRVNIHLGDAREWLMTTPDRYDVIISEPSNPYRAGIASLFSVAFYEAADARLSEDGLFLQWIQAYELSEETLQMAMATLRTVFAHVEIWEGASGGDLLMVASQAPVSHSGDRLGRRVTEEPFLSGLAVGWRVAGLPGLYASYVAGTAFVDTYAAGAPVNTDDHPRMEFGFARHVGAETELAVDALRRQAAAQGHDRPPLDVPLDPVALLDARFSKAIAGRSPPDVPGGVPAALAARMTARRAWIDADWQTVVSAWAAQDAAPQGPLDHLALGEALAARGDPAALAHAQALSGRFPTEARLIAAQLAASRGEADAVPLLAEAFSLAEADPWVHARALKRGLRLAWELGQAPEAAAVLMPRLMTRFAEGNVDAVRRGTALVLAGTAGFAEWCGPALAPLEPHVPWDAGVLRGRARCYALTNDPRQGLAEAELARFEAMTPAP